MGNLYGYLILAIFAFVFIGISVFVSKKFPVEGVDDFVAAGRGIRPPWWRPASWCPGSGPPPSWAPPRRV